MERELATKAPRTQGGAESHSGQRAGVAPFAPQMQATARSTLVLPPRRAGLARVQLPYVLLEGRSVHAERQKS